MILWGSEAGSMGVPGSPIPPRSPTWLCAWVSTVPGFPSLQLWAISSGDLLLSVLFDMGIMSVTMDLAEHHIFCGGNDGSIFQVDLCSWVSGLLGLRHPQSFALHCRHLLPVSTHSPD